MRTPNLILVLSYSILISLLVSADALQKGPKNVEKWFKKLPNTKEKVTKLHFYFHDVVSGKNPTSISVARANSTFTSPSYFGLVSIIDNPLTLGSGPKSKVVGRAQGITGSASSDELCLLMTLNFVFMDGKYNESTLSIVGYNPINYEYREMPIVGGSGVFRLARGIATANTAKFNAKTGNAVVEYNVMDKEMDKLCTILMLFSIVSVITHAKNIAQGPEAVEDWFKNLPNAKEKVTKLHFYFHDIVGGKNPSAITVAQSNSTFQSPTFFGLIRMMDNALTVGPEPDSKIVGRAQGIYGSASFEEIGLLMTLNYVFTGDKYNGSTISVLGHNPILHKYREMPIVGGSGIFRLARGIATAQTIWFNLTTQDAVVEYNVIVLHY
ncbi:hypothetical protein BUALT_Bualt15G0012100 [Buddleja alternifolia]|uniref:Dirigent protein n=1 Tax=Buddleja alternifolia TaxID=168488 RepID=A0AAV6WH11_9LAMI|nr:hypothetical protein BUALT_Bualt15G0012100 [Buddleja alternifolia]